MFKPTTDDRVHGAQAGAFFNGYYGDYCFLPLYVFCGEQLLVSYLRPSNLDGARHAWAILSFLVKALRRRGLAGTELARAQVGTIRLKLLKVGAVGVRNTWRVRLWFSSAFPLQEVFRHGVACFYG